MAPTRPYYAERGLSAAFYDTVTAADARLAGDLDIYADLAAAGGSILELGSGTGRLAIALAQRYNLDSRDQGASERARILSDHEGIWGCTFVGECTKVCPKHVDPAGAIQRYKLSAALDWAKAFFLPWGAR